MSKLVPSHWNDGKGILGRDAIDYRSTGHASAAFSCPRKVFGPIEDIRVLESRKGITLKTLWSGVGVLICVQGGVYRSQSQVGHGVCAVKLNGESISDPWGNPGWSRDERKNILLRGGHGT